MGIASNISVITLAALGSGSVFADSMRCNHRLIGTGTSEYEVVLHCGEPNYMQVVKEPIAYQSVTQAEFYTPASGVDPTEPGTLNMLEIEPRYREIERWTYHPSSGRLIREVDFLEGKVLRITSTGRAP